MGGGGVLPEFPLSAGGLLPGGLGRLLPLAEAALESAAGRIDGAVLDVDLSRQPLPVGWQEALGRLVEMRDRFCRPRRLAAAIRITLPCGGDLVGAVREAGPDILNAEVAAGLPLFRAALRAADLRGLLAALALVAAPSLAGFAAQARELVRKGGPVLGAVSARPFVREIEGCLRQQAVPEAVCAIALATCAVPVLAACEAGADGPAREGAWESLFVREIAGCPVSLSAARPWEPAVLARSDLWHGGGPAEITVSECLRLRRGQAPVPGPLSPGAVARILCADAISTIAEAIQTCQQPYHRAVAAAYAASTMIGESGSDAPAAVPESDRELALRAAEELISLPESGQELLEEAGSKYGSSILSGESIE